MKRRVVLKNIVLGTGAVMYLPSCFPSEEPQESLFLGLNNQQVDNLAEIARSIIPVSAEISPLELHLFPLRMVNDCYQKEEQERFITGFTHFERTLRGPFSSYASKEKNSLLNQLEKRNGDTAYFYQTYKRLVITGYTTSEYYLTEVRPYTLTPGYYSGCVAV